MLTTRTPRLSAARGFSPAERSRSPSTVRFSTHQAATPSTTVSGTTGEISPSPGRSILGSERTAGDCASWPSPKATMDRKRGTPRARMLIATPDTIWSTRKVTVATAWISATSVPARVAISRPAIGPKRSDPQAPNQVPKIIIPSMPMFTMPDRSLNKPPRVARNRGTKARMSEAMTAMPKSWPKISGTFVGLLEPAPRRQPANQLEGDDDGQDQHALEDDDDLRGHLGPQLDAGGAAVEEREQQGGGDDAEAGVAAEQGDGDAGEPEAADVVDLHQALQGQDLLETDQPGDRAGQQHRLHVHGVGPDPGRLGRPRVGAQHPQLVAEPGPADGQGIDDGGQQGDQEEPGQRDRR